MKSVLAIRHVHFEGLGLLGDVLAEDGFQVDSVDAGVDDLAALDPLKADLLVVLGGPIGAYERYLYPFLNDEVRILKARLAAGRPTLGICLGAQLMAVALGARYSGVLGNCDELLQKAVQAGQQSGERLCVFPMDEDYEPALDSKVADIKQCTLDGEADHILAARFLKRFLEHDVPWLHVDLSSSRCEGGLGSVASDVTGFGVGWGLRMLK